MGMANDCELRIEDLLPRQRSLASQEGPAGFEIRTAAIEAATTEPTTTEVVRSVLTQAEVLHTVE